MLIRRSVFNSPVMLLPFYLLFVFVATDFLVLFNFQNSANTNIFFVDEGLFTEDIAIRDSVEEIKGRYKTYIIFLIAVLAAGNVRKLWFFLKGNWNIAFLFSAMLMTYFSSSEKSQVIANVANVAFTLIACLLAASYLKSRSSMIRSALLLIFTSCATVILLSIVLWFSLDSDPWGQLQSGFRFAGVTGNPNTLGLLTLLSIWSGLALTTQQSKRFSTKPIIYVLCIISLFLLYTTSSATSWVLTAIAIAAMIWGRFVQKASSAISITVNLVGLFIMLVGAMALIVTQGNQSFLSIFTESLGKDATFTGRDELWLIAVSAINEKPIFGWGFDSHLSVMSRPEYFVHNLNHFHNGILDTVVAGGVVLLLALIFHLYKFIRGGMKIIYADKNGFVLLMPVLFMLLHNMTEYSILRTNSMLWSVHLFCYAILACYFSSAELKQSHLIKRKSIKSKRTHFRF